MREEGLVFITVLLAVVVVLALVSSLAAVLAIEVRLSSYNLNEIRAGYFAEAGLAEALNRIRNAVRTESSITSGELEGIAGYEVDNGYQITEAFLPGDLEEKIYRLTSLGRAAGNSREIRVDISPEDKSRTLTAGGEIKRILITAGSGRETAVAGEDYWEGLGAGIPRMTPGDLADYVNCHPEAAPLTYQDGEAGDDYVLNIEPGELAGSGTKLIYVMGDLVIEPPDGEAVYSLVGGTPPVMVLVTGDVLIKDAAGMENYIFICLGSFQFEQSVDNTRIKNTFIYAGGKADFNRSAEYHSGFHLSGMVISREVISVISEGGQVDRENYSITLPPEFARLNTVKRPHITGWQE